MKKEYKQLKKIIHKSQNILILTHKSPDFDAFSSSLILKKYINTVYPKKNVLLKTRQLPTQNIPYMHEITVVENIHTSDEDLVILTDSGSWDICTTTADTIQLTKAKLAIIDHHDTLSDTSHLTINNNMSSATEQVLDFCIKVGGRKFKINKEISTLAQIGIVSDTGRFLFENTRPETYELMSKLRKVFEFDIQDFEYKNGKFPIESLVPIRIYIQNLKTEQDMAYTYLTNEQIQSNGIEKVDINYAQMFVRENILRYMHGIHWGFVIKPSFANENEWQVSFRGTMGYQKVDKIAEELKGGGHEYSSAARVNANDGTQAVEIVLDTIQKVLQTTPSQAPSPTPSPST